MKLSSVVLAATLFAAPVYAQTQTPAPATRYAASSVRIVGPQAGTMLREFSGKRALAAFKNSNTSFALLGTLDVTDTKIGFTFAQDYAGPGQISTISEPQTFYFDFILVGQDTVASGALFAAQFHYVLKSGDTAVLLLRFFEGGRAAGVMTINDAAGKEVGGYIVFSNPTADAGSFFAFIDETSEVFIAMIISGNDAPAVMARWGAGKWVSPNSQ